MKNQLSLKKPARFVFCNAGTIFQFEPNEVPGFNKNGPTMMQIHARMTLDANYSGKKDVYILDSSGVPFSTEDLKSWSRNTAAQMKHKEGGRKKV